jgi:short-subunit dehydrogenase
MGRVLLIGGRSVIGRALARGIMHRTHSDGIIAISRQELHQEAEIHGTIITADYMDIDYSKIFESEEVVAVVIALGNLHHHRTDFVSSLEKNFEVNVFLYLKVLERILAELEIAKGVEIHLTSSILADFTRGEVAAYSYSKQTMQKAAEYLLKRNRKNAFIWKFAFVDSPLNLGRSRSSVYTTASSIERYATRRRRAGIYYVPPVSRVPSRVLYHLSFLSNFRLM